MKKHSYRPGHGLAFSKTKDTELFARMASEGYRPVHLNLFGIYKFERCAPEEVVFAADCSGVAQGSPDFEEYVGIFESAGWSFAFGQNGCNFFKAPKGATPIFTDSHSEAQMYRLMAKRVVPAILVCLAAFILFIAIINLIGRTPFAIWFWALAGASAGAGLQMAWATALCYYRSWQTLRS